MAKQTFTTGQVLTADQMTSLQQTAMGGGAATAKTANYVLVAADAGTTVAMDAAGATTITVNTGLFAAGDTVFIQNLGAGACTVTAGTATVATAGSLILPQNDAGILYFTSASAAIFYDYIQVGATSPLTTKGDIYVYGTSDTRLPVGTDSYTLVANSSTSTGLEWQAPASGGMTLLASGALSSTSTTYNVVTTGYTYLQIFMNNVYATADNTITMRINGDTGSNYALCGITSGVSDNKFASATSYRITAGTGTSDQVLNNANAFIQIFDPNSTSQMAISHQAMCGPSGDMRFNAANGNYDCSAAITSILFLHPTGSFSSGTVSIYGVK
jgi:hypothetical protein